MVKRLLTSVAVLLASVATLAGVALIIRVAFDDGEEATLTFAPTATATAMEDEGEEHLEEIISRGRELYLSVGCAACHGQNAEGSSIGPALPGHTEEQVKSQVRNPIKNMPAFSQAQIDDEGLDAIAAYITSLGVGVAHV
ncbi:MAG: cytochrome c, partial [Dehalococcoidia bacterium]